MRHRPTRVFALCVILVGTVFAFGGVATAHVTVLPSQSEPTGGAIPLDESPIKHVVIIFQENHSFDNVLGALCVIDARCDGTETGTLYGGTTIPLAEAPDVVPVVEHSTYSHRTSIDGGKMDGFSKIRGCTAATNYACYSQYYPSQIPNLAALAREFVISDMTFETGGPSFGAHIGIVSPTLDGFSDERVAGQVPPKHGGGCASDKDAPWYAPGATSPILVPSCIPDYNLNPTLYPYGGAYRATPVPYVPTLMDRLDAGGVSWRIYGDAADPSGWSICPTFAECAYGPQAANLVPNNDVLKDARAGTLPGFSIVTPTHKHSQHNSESMTIGDDWIGSVVGAIESGPDWGSTAIFITYDDCGCFYDHVPPPAGSGMGIRVPMVIVSPYAKPGFTDSETAGFPSLMAFTEHLFNLPPLGTADAQAYDYSDSFDFTQTPLAPVEMRWRRISPAEAHYIAAHPMNPNDPT